MNACVVKRRLDLCARGILMFHDHMVSNFFMILSKTGGGVSSVGNKSYQDCWERESFSFVGFHSSLKVLSCVE